MLQKDLGRTDFIALVAIIKNKNNQQNTRNLIVIKNKRFVQKVYGFQMSIKTKNLNLFSFDHIFFINFRFKYLSKITAS